jgi:4-amino-4-deoxy-L-arabinose transferase-like glycosyltransferase
MFETGDFVRISFQDEPRHKKPVGIHWLQAVTVAATGGPEARAIWAYRLPSLAGALLAALATFWIGARLANRRVGLVAGAALGVSVLLSTEAGIAKTDAMLCGLITLSFAGLAGLRTGAGKPAAFAFWIGIAGATLVKGPIGPLVIGLALLALALWERRPAWMAPLLHPPAVLLGLAIVLPWMIAIGIATEGAFFIEAITQDLAPKVAGGHEDHGGPPGYHLALVAINAWPGALILPAGAILAWRFREEPAVRFLVAWAVPGWLLFELAPTKLFHYALPLYPALFLLGAAALDRGLGASRGARWAALALLALGTLIIAALAPVVASEYRGAMPLAALTAAVAGGLGLAAMIQIGRDRMASALCLAAAAGIGFSALSKGAAIPSAQDLMVSPRVAAGLERAGLGDDPARPIVGAGYSEPSLIFLTRTNTELTTPERAASLAVDGGSAVVDQAQMQAFLSGLAARGLQAEEVDRVAGLNYSRGDPVDLRLLRISPCDGSCQAAR